MATLIRAGACLLLLALAACEPAPLSVRFDRPQIVVHSMLIAGEQSADVLVISTSTAGGEWGYSRGRPVTGATVRLIAGADTFTLAPLGRLCGWLSVPEPERTAGCYSTVDLRGGIQPGTRYDLVVDLPGGERVTGSTVVPAFPLIHAPAAGAAMQVRRGHSTATLPSMTIAWSGALPERRAEFRIDVSGCVVHFAGDLPAHSFGTISMEVSGRSQAVFTPMYIGCDENSWFVHGDGRLAIAAYDENYTRYARSAGDNSVLAQDAQVGITGAFGMFGSVAVSYRTVDIEVITQ